MPNVVSHKFPPVHQSPQGRKAAHEFVIRVEVVEVFVFVVGFNPLVTIVAAVNGTKAQIITVIKIADCAHAVPPISQGLLATYRNAVVSRSILNLD